MRPNLELTGLHTTREWRAIAVADYISVLFTVRPLVTPLAAEASGPPATRTAALTAPCDSRRLSDGLMTDRANAILRGGPFDGEQITTDPLLGVLRTEHGATYYYRPTGEPDDEFSTLHRYVLDRMEPSTDASV
jgi:hypothetical protein